MQSNLMVLIILHAVLCTTCKSYILVDGLILIFYILLLLISTILHLVLSYSTDEKMHLIVLHHVCEEITACTRWRREIGGSEDVKNVSSPKYPPADQRYVHVAGRGS
jgi:hypothetical protein